MIETVQPADVPALLDFMERVVAESVTASAEAKRAFTDNIHGNVALWAADPGASLHLKAVEGDVVLGVMLVRDYRNLCTLFVDPAHHRRGIGAGLVREGIARCRVRASSPVLRLNSALNAVEFYEAMGFRRTVTDKVTEFAIPMELVL